MKEKLKNAAVAIVAAVCFVIVLPVILIVCLAELICRPFKVQKYKRSHYYRDFGAKYFWGILSDAQYKLYNEMKNENLPIEFVPVDVGKPSAVFGYFHYRDTLIIHDIGCDLYYDEEAQMWMTCEEYEDRDEDISLDDYIAESIKSFNALDTGVVCKNAVVLVDHESLYDRNRNTDLPRHESFLPIGTGEIAGAVKAYIGAHS